MYDRDNVLSFQYRIISLIRRSVHLISTVLSSENIAIQCIHDSFLRLIRFFNEGG